MDLNKCCGNIIIYMDRKILSQLSQEQQIVYTAMMLPSDKTPAFPISQDIIELGNTFKTLFDTRKLTHMYLDNNARVHVS